MRIALITLFISLATFSIAAEKMSFKEYTNHFRTINIDTLSNNLWSYITLKFGGKDENLIDKRVVEKFICPNLSPCELGYDYVYSYGIKVCINEFIILIPIKTHFEGYDPYAFDLNEMLIMIYDQEGKCFYCKSIAKDSELWVSEVFVEKPFKILVKQSKALKMEEISKSITQYIEYTLADDGYLVDKIMKEKDSIMFLNKESLKPEIIEND